MTAVTADISKFIKNSDYPQDMVIYLKSDSFVVPNPTAGYYYSVAHGLSFTPLVGGSWSTISDFSVSYDFGSGTIPSSNPSVSPFNTYLEILADATNVYIVPTNVSGASQTVYVRITGLEPADSASELTATESQGDSFVFNSNNNYTKLFESDYLVGVTPSTTNSVTHNLGVYPQVSAWATSTSRSLVAGSVFLANVRYPIYSTSFNAGVPDDISVSVWTNRVDFVTGAFSNVNRIDHRIYYDETGS